MYKYAEIYGGKVRDIQESRLSFVEFCSIYDPTAFWMDVTGVDNVQIGSVLKSSTELGMYFELPEVEEETVESVRNAKLELLDKRFKEQLDKAYIMSSLGVPMNAGTRAKDDVDGLIKQMEAEGIDTTSFMSYEDILVPVTLDELKTLQLEIIKNGHSVYQQKWHYREAIKNAVDIETLKRISIEFKMLDFMNNCYWI